MLVLAAILGVFLISFDDLALNINMFRADMFVFFSAIIGALYVLGLGLLARSKDFEFASFLGYVGVINCIILLPILAVLHYQKIEIFEVPPVRELYLLFTYSIVTTLLWEYFWAKAATILGANFTTVAFTLITLPIGILLDFLLVENDENFTKVYIAGVILIVFSFLGISWVMDPEPEF